MHEHTKPVFLVLRVNCWVLKVQPPVWFECVLPEFAQPAGGGKLTCTKAWQLGPSSAIFGRLTIPVLNKSSSYSSWTQVTGRALRGSHCSWIFWLLRSEVGKSCGNSSWVPFPCGTNHDVPLAVERHLPVVIIRAVVNVGCFILCHWTSALLSLGMYGEASELLPRLCVNLSSYLCSSSTLFVFLTVLLQQKFAEILLSVFK